MHQIPFALLVWLLRESFGEAIAHHIAKSLLVDILADQLAPVQRWGIHHVCALRVLWKSLGR
jgi:hypothetical protein